LRWRADGIAVGALGAVGGLLALVQGENVGVAVLSFAIAVIACSYAKRARLEFRRGWRQGYETAVRVMLERSASRTTDVEARAAVLGDPTPEPWDEHVAVRLPNGSGR
jgi:hypothetical protein